MASWNNKPITMVEKLKLMLVILVLGCLVGSSTGKVYKVGDEAGWTIIGNVNYTAWASSKSFHVGDTIVFVYNKQFHDVVKVSKGGYKSCNASAPIAKYNSGNDSVVLKHKGHHFFISSPLSDCQIGQKVNIRIPKNDTSHVVAPFFAAPGPSPSALEALPQQSSTHSTSVLVMWVLALTFANAGVLASVRFFSW